MVVPSACMQKQACMPVLHASLLGTQRRRSYGSTLLAPVHCQDLPAQANVPGL